MGQVREGSMVRDGASNGNGGKHILRVLREPPGQVMAGDQAVEEPPEVLRSAFRQADRAFEAVLKQVGEKYYKEMAVPVHLPIPEEATQELCQALGLEETSPWVLGPVRIQSRGSAYWVSIQLLPCG